MIAKTSLRKLDLNTGQNLGIGKQFILTHRRAVDPEQERDNVHTFLRTYFVRTVRRHRGQLRIELSKPLALPHRHELIADQARRLFETSAEVAVMTIRTTDLDDEFPSATRLFLGKHRLERRAFSLTLSPD